MKQIVPTLWKYFFKQYTKTLLLSLFGFVVILLATKLQDFALFVSIGAPLPLVGLFVLYQIPYVLQIAIPISCLIAALYLFQRLSQNHSIAAARASGISMFELIIPLLIFNTIFSLVTFRYLLDISASCHKSLKQLEFELRELHPLAIFHNTKFLEQNGMNIEMQGSLENEKQAQNFTLVARYGDEDHLAILSAERLHVDADAILGEHFAWITAQVNEDPQQFDTVVIENVKKNTISFKDLALLVTKKRLRIGNDDLSFALLLAKKQDLEEKVRVAISLHDHVRFTQGLLAKCSTEIFRRISLALSIITFSILGMSYGITVGRIQSKRRLIEVVALTAIYLICYLGGKALETHTLISALLYFSPHVVIIGRSIFRLHLIQKGQEV